MPPESRIPLHALCGAGAARAASPVLGWAPGAWAGRVAAWRAAFEGQPAADVALYFEDAGEFSAALFGAWLAGRTPWLPGDALAGTRTALARHGVAWAGDPPGALRAADGNAMAPPATLDPEACRLVLFTSGTTGEPQPVAKTMGQLDRELASLEAAFGGRLGAAPVFGTVSHQHIYGLLFRVLWPLSAGRPFAPARKVYNEELVVLGPEPLVLVASPAHLKRLPPNQDWASLRAGLRAVFSSGGPLAPDAALDVRTLWDQAAIEVFGSTETGGIAWRAPGGEQAPWTPLPGVQWTLDEGRLCIRSPHLADGGWLQTSDRAEAAPDGGFLLRGRADRIVKIEERRVSLGAIEAALLASGLVDEARVVALPGHRVLLGAAVVPGEAGRARLASAGRAALLEALRQSLEGQVDRIAWPRRWRVVDALPVDARGKTTQRALGELFRPPMPAPEWDERGAAHASGWLRVDEELAAFDGHFPQALILPGVALLDWATRLAADAFGLAGTFEGMETVKFQHLVRPGTRLEFRLDWDAARSRLGFRFASGVGVHGSGWLRFAAGEGR